MDVQMVGPPQILNSTNMTLSQNPVVSSNAYDQVVPLIFGVALSAITICAAYNYYSQRRMRRAHICGFVATVSIVTTAFFSYNFFRNTPQPVMVNFQN